MKLFPSFPRPRAPRRSRLPAIAALASLALLTAGMIVQPACADQLDSIRAAHVLRVAVPEDYPPFGSPGADMKLQGYDIDMANLLAKTIGVEVKLIPVTSANRMAYLLSGRADLTISSLAKTADREKVIDFSQAYAPYYQGVFGPAGIKVTGPADLAGKTIGATRGTVEEMTITQTAPPSATIKRFDDNAGTIAAFLSGQVQLFAAGNVVATAIIAKHPPRVPESKYIFRNSPCYIGVMKEQPRLLDLVNQTIDRAKHDGTLNGISQKWLDIPLPANL